MSKPAAIPAHAASLTLVDSHCHLNFPDFKEDLPQVLANAASHGVKYLQTICTYMGEFERVYAIAEDRPNIFCSVGVHPNHVAEEPLVEVATLVEKAALPKVIGLGETGLDYYYDYAPKAMQQESFRRHIQAAQQTGLPIIVHTRDAEEDTVAILREMREEANFPALIHCFSSEHWLAEACLDMGIYLSIPGIVTFKKAEALQESVRQLPLESLLVETDAPYLAPVPYRGKRNEPAYTYHTAQAVADLKGVSVEEVARVTTHNFFSLFSKANPLVKTDS